MVNSRRVLGFFVCSSLLMLPAYPSPKKTKEEKFTEKEQKAEEKNTARYEKVKDFAVNKYKTDPDFRDRVDAELQQIMRKHSDEAYATNRWSGSRMVRVREDSWREHYNLYQTASNQVVTLYDNAAVQNYINRTGQKLAPPDSEKLYAFRVISDPIPMARSLATGT